MGDPTYPASAGSAGIYTGSVTGSAITSWAKTSTLTAPSGSMAFGTAVAITAAGTEALVGDPTGGGGTGAASSYSAPSGTWSATTTATALTAPPYPGAFGTAVAVSGDASSAFVGDALGTDTNPALAGTVSAYSANGRFWNLGTVAVPPANASSFGTTLSMSSPGTSVLEGDVFGRRRVRVYLQRLDTQHTDRPHKSRRLECLRDVSGDFGERVDRRRW